MNDFIKSILVLTLLLVPGQVQAEVVQRIADGDTFVLESGEKIRLYGINSPELNTSKGKKAKEYLTKIMPVDSQIQLIRINKDQYKRSVSIVIYDGKIINEELIKAGHANVFERYCKLDICHEWRELEK